MRERAPRAPHHQRVSAQPLNGVFTIADIILLIGRISRTRFFNGGAPITSNRAIADAAGWVSYAVHHMQRLDFLPEAIVIFRAAEVQLADGIDDSALLPEAMPPAGHAVPS